jgi:ribosomal protein S18 acetylase RimI-like enzyme
VIIRNVETRDRDAWAPLFVAYGEFYEATFTDEVVESTWSRLLAPTEGIDGLVAEVDGTVVGFAHYRSHPDTFSTGRDWFLDDLYVDPAARSGGVASALIEHIVGMMTSAEHGSLRWITAESNERAQRLYDRIARRSTWVTYEVRP